MMRPFVILAGVLGLLLFAVHSTATAQSVGWNPAPIPPDRGWATDKTTPSKTIFSQSAAWAIIKTKRNKLPVYQIAEVLPQPDRHGRRAYRLLRKDYYESFSEAVYVINVIRGVRIDNWPRDWVGEPPLKPLILRPKEFLKHPE